MSRFRLRGPQAVRRTLVRSVPLQREPQPRVPEPIAPSLATSLSAESLVMAPLGPVPDAERMQARFGNALLDSVGRERPLASPEPDQENPAPASDHSSGDQDNAPTQPAKSEASAIEPQQAEEKQKQETEDAESDADRFDRSADGDMRAEVKPSHTGQGEVADAEPASAGGGGAGEPDLAAWKSSVDRSIGGLPRPSLGKSKHPGIRIREVAASSVRQRKLPAGQRVQQAKKAIPKPPPTPKPLPPPPPSPVPFADTLIELASDLKLPDQTLPTLKPTPNKHIQPSVNITLAAEMGTQIPLPEPEKPDNQVAASAKDKQRLAQLDKAAKPDKITPKTVSGGQSLVLKDTVPAPGPAPKVGVGGQSKQQVAEVLAELLRKPTPKEGAEEMVTAARESAYPKKSLQRNFPDMGKEFVDELATKLKQKIDGIRRIAGISEQQMARAVQARAQKAKQLQAKAKDAISQEHDLGRKAISDNGEEEKKQIAAAKSAVDDYMIQLAAAAKGDADPEVICMVRDKALANVSRRVVRQDHYYDKAGERRLKALGAMLTRMKGAYKKAAQQERGAFEKEFLDAGSEPADAKSKADTATKPTFKWAATEAIELKRRFGELIQTVATSTQTLRDGITTAGKTAKQMIRKWAQDKIGEQEGFWDKILRQVREWMQDARDDAAAWEETSNDRLRDDLVHDLGLLGEIQQAAAKGVDVRTYIQGRGLDQAQGAILQTYFKGDAKDRDAITAVAAGMRIRLQGDTEPQTQKRFRAKTMAEPDSNWDPLSKVANSESPFNVVTIASKLHAAMDQWGTDESAIYAALGRFTPLQAKVLRAYYRQRYPDTGGLDKHLKSELSGAELTRAEAQLAGDQTVADVATLREAMAGAGTAEAAIMRVLRGKSKQERDKIAAEYKRRYKRELNDDLKSEMSGFDLDRAQALVAGDVRKADAIAIKQSTQSGWLGIGADTDQMRQVYAENRAEVEAEAAKNGWDTKQVEDEIRKRNAQIEAKYQTVSGAGELKPGETSALKQDFNTYLYGPERKLAFALADNDMAKADAARLEIERRSFVTDDEVVNNILASQYQRARRDVERDERLKLEHRAMVDDLYDRPWDRTRWEQERKDSKQRVDELAKQKGKQYMGKLETAYDTDFSRFGKGGLQVLIAFNMSGNDQRKAYDLLEQGGYLEPEQEIFYAVNGPGTDVDKLKDVFAGKSPAEIQKIRDTWQKRYGNREGDLDSRVMSEVSGRDAQDMKWGLAGEPQTPEGNVARRLEQLKYEQSAYWFGNSFSDSERKFMQQRHAALQQELDKLNRYEKGSEDYRLALEDFELEAAYFDQSVKDHRAAVDSLADTVASIAAVVATVVVIVVATIATGGVAAVASLGALATAASSASVAATAAAAAAVATIGTKVLLKGGANTYEDLAADAVVGIVDAAVTALTAGLGGALLKTARTAKELNALGRFAKIVAKSPAGRLAKAAASGNRGTRMLAHALAEGAESAIQSIPSALAGNIAREKNWVHGDPLSNILGGTAIEGGLAVGLGAGLGSLGGIAKHADEAAGAAGDLASSADVLARRGSPLDRAAAWADYQIEFPGRGYREFLDDLDAGLVAKAADDSARKNLQRQLRGELLASIPPAQRGPFAGVPIEVLSDADFERFARSSSGQALVIFENGQPRVILREGADPKVLREEGIHLLQSKDPKLAAKIAELDELRLKHWDSLDLEEQFRLYRIKLEVEIDGQQRLLRDLRRELAVAGEGPALRRSLQDQIDNAEHHLRNLGSRLGEVDATTPAARSAMSRGELEVPDFLDQPPRLFSKKGKTPGLDPEVKSPLPDAEVPVPKQAAATAAPPPEQVRALTEVEADKVIARLVDLPDDSAAEIRKRLLTTEGAQLLEEAKQAYKRLHAKGLDHLTEEDFIAGFLDQGRDWKTLIRAAEAAHASISARTRGKVPVEEYIRKYLDGLEYKPTTNRWYRPDGPKVEQIVIRNDPDPEVVIDAALGHLNQEKAAWRQYFDMLKNEGLIERADADDIVRNRLREILANMGDKDEIKVDDLRKKLRKTFEEKVFREVTRPRRLRERFPNFDWVHHAADSYRRASNMRLQEIADHLASADKGVLGEIWYHRVHARVANTQVRINEHTITHCDVEKFADLQEEELAKRGILAIMDPKPKPGLEVGEKRIVDLLGGTTNIELKTISGPLGERSKPQLENLMRLAGRGDLIVEVAVPGRSETLFINKLDVVFSLPEGSRANRKWMIEQFETHGAHGVTFHLFNASGRSLEVNKFNYKQLLDEGNLEKWLLAGEIEAGVIKGPKFKMLTAGGS